LQQSFFIENLVNSVASTLTGDKCPLLRKSSARSPEIGSKHFDKFKPELATKLDRNLAGTENHGLTHNSDLGYQDCTQLHLVGFNHTEPHNQCWS